MYQFITGEYRSDGAARIYVRDENNKKSYFDVYDHKPHYYIDENDYVPRSDWVTSVEKGHKDLWGNKLKRVNVISPDIVPKLRYKSTRTYEADVNYILRVMIDLGIYSSFDVEDLKLSNKIHYTQIKGISNSVLMPPVSCILDIEVNTLKGNPDNDNPIGEINCVTLYDTIDKIYYTTLLDFGQTESFTEKKLSDDWIQYTFNDEKAMLSFIMEYLMRIKPDLFCGWYVEFDIGYMKARYKHLNINWECTGYNLFDFIPFYRRIRGKSFGNKLKEVVIEEKIDLNPVLEEYDNEYWTNRELHDKLVLYNKKDVEYCVDLNNKYPGNGTTTIDFFWNLKCRVGHPNIEFMHYNTWVIDTLALHLAKEWNVVLPTSTYHAEEDYKGGLVLQPKIGIAYGIALLDMATYYPATIIMGNFSPEYSHLSLKERRKKKLGFIPTLCQMIMIDRKKADASLEEIEKLYGSDSPQFDAMNAARKSIKFLLNAVYGWLAYRKCRINDRMMMAKMVKLTRLGLGIIVKIAKKCGFKVVYGDTDSILIEIPQHMIKKFMTMLNKALTKLAVKNKLTPLWQVKCETYSDKIIFARSKGSKRAAKKRYVMRITEKDGKPVDPYLIVKGFDTIRGDQSKITKNIQKRCFEAILDEKIDEFIDEVKKIVIRMRKGKFDLKDMVISMNLGDHPDNYKTNIDYVRGSKYNNRHIKENIIKGDRIKMIYIKKVVGLPPTNIICFKDERKLPEIVIDYERMISRTIEGKISHLLEIVNRSWGDIKGQKKLKGFI